MLVEIRGGAGGDEAALFAGDLYKMLSRYAEELGFGTEILSQSPAEVGGFKDVTFAIKGDGAYSIFKYEGGTHRVQRVPKTESQGRIHTSTATVAVLPEAEEVDVDVDPNDLQIDVYRSSGPRRAVGQHDRLRGAHHPQAERDRRLDAGREVAAAEPRQGDARAPGAAAGEGDRRPAGRDLGRAQVAGRDRRALGEDPHLQLPAGARHRPPDQADEPRARRGAGRQPARVQRRAQRPRRSAASSRRRPPGPDGLRPVRHGPPGPFARRSRRRPTRSAPPGPIRRASTPSCCSPRRRVAPASRSRPIPEGAVSGAEARAFGGFVRRRVAREPVAYILGRRGFRNIELRTDRRVLVPRPETELLVEVALELDPGSVLDVGTGSGAIALALADELPSASIVAVDVSADALAVAAENAAALGLGERVELPPRLGGRRRRGRVRPRRREPPLRARGRPGVAGAGDHPLRARGRPVLGSRRPRRRSRPARRARARAATGRRADAVALEIGDGQAGEVAELVRAAGFPRVEIRADLAGIERVVVGRR